MTKSKLTFLGETHGAAVNPMIVKEVIEDREIKTVFFEWPKVWQDAIREGSVDEIKNIVKGYEDGRFLREHLSLLEFLRDKNIAIFCLDGKAETWNERDAQMAANLKDILKEINSQNSNSLVVTGNLHARKKDFEMNGETWKSLASYFKDISESIFIQYGKGEIFNFGIKELPQNELEDKRKTGLSSYEGEDFDLQYFVLETSAGHLV